MWLFNDEEFTQEMIGKYQAFVYEIKNNLTGEKYIGKKKFTKVRKVKDRVNRVRSVSDWQDYWSSSKRLKADVEKYGEENFTRRIIVLCLTWGDAGYIETMLQFKYNVLENPDYINDNCGKYRRTTDRIKLARMWDPKDL